MAKIVNIFKKLKKKAEAESLPAQVTPTSPTEPEKPKPEVTDATQAAAPEAKSPTKRYFTNIVKFKEEAEPQVAASPEALGADWSLYKDESVKLYEETKHFLQGICKEMADYKSLKIEIITEQVEKIVDLLQKDKGKYLLMLALDENLAPSNYPFTHCLNTCIYALEVGAALEYTQSQLIELGIASIIHDVGMIEYLNLVNQPKKLSPK